MRRRLGIWIVVVVLAAVVPAGPAVAATCTTTWKGTGKGIDGSWTTPGGWTGGAVPGATDVACLPVGSPAYTVTMQDDQTVDEIVVASGATLRLDSATVMAGGVHNDGAVVGNGRVMAPVVNTGTLRPDTSLALGGGLVGGGTIDSTAGHLVVLGGTAEQGDGTTIGNPADVAPGATLVFAGTGQASWRSVGGTVGGTIAPGQSLVVQNESGPGVTTTFDHLVNRGRIAMGDPMTSSTARGGLRNEGSLAVGASGARVDGTLTNTGTVTTANILRTSGLDLEGGSVSGSGLLLVIDGDAVQRGGDVTSKFWLDNGTVDLEGGTGTVQLIRAGLAGTVATGRSIMLSGLDGVDSWLVGTVTNHGSISVGGAATLGPRKGAAAAHLVGDGSVDVQVPGDAFEVTAAVDTEGRLQVGPASGHGSTPVALHLDDRLALDGPAAHVTVSGDLVLGPASTLVLAGGGSVDVSGATALAGSLDGRLTPYGGAGTSQLVIASTGVVTGAFATVDGGRTTLSPHEVRFTKLIGLRRIPHASRRVRRAVAAEDERGALPPQPAGTAPV